MRLDQTIADSQTLGLKTIVCSPRPRLRTSDDWKSMADELNKYGERTKAAGLQLGYHNHEIEFVKTPRGRRALGPARAGPPIRRSSSSSSTSATARSAAATHTCIWTSTRRRYYGVHVKDFVKGKAAVPVGSGSLDWKRIFTLVKAANITNIVAEVGAYGASTLRRPAAPPPEYSVLELYKRSAEFLKAFKDV